RTPWSSLGRQVPLSCPALRRPFPAQEPPGEVRGLRAFQTSCLRRRDNDILCCGRLTNRIASAARAPYASLMSIGTAFKPAADQRFTSPAVAATLAYIDQHLG